MKQQLNQRLPAMKHTNDIIEIHARLALAPVKDRREQE
jgi:hypothetical protein